jgi:hypothetical protein
MANENNESKEITPAASWLWIKDSAGYPSITVTFVTISFWVTTLAYMLSIFEKIGPVNIRQFDSTAATAYFVPLLGLYFGRRWTDARFGNPNVTATQEKLMLFKRGQQKWISN